MCHPTRILSTLLTLGLKRQKPLSSSKRIIKNEPTRQSQPIPNLPMLSVFFARVRSILCRPTPHLNHCHMKVRSQLWKKIIYVWIASTRATSSRIVSLSTNVENAKGLTIPCCMWRHQAILLHAHLSPSTGPPNSSDPIKITSYIAHRLHIRL